MKNNKKLIPELRFPEFENEGEWEIKTLSGICDITNGKANAQDHVDNGRYPLFDRSEVIKASDEFIFDCEAVIIPGEGMKFIPKYYEGKFNLHQRAYALKDFSCSGQFVYYSMLHRSTLLSQKAVQSTVLSLRLPILQDFPIEIPKKPEEQEKIASCLSSLDEVISAHSQKLELLKAHKKGLLQNLFPQEGEKVPKLRFKEFEKDGEWEEKLLDEIVNEFIVPMRNKPQKLDGEIPWCRIEDFNGIYLSESKSNQGVTLETVKDMNLKIYPINTLLVSCSADLGRCAITKQPLITNQTFIGLVPDFNKVDVLYLYYVMTNSSNELNAKSSGTTISYLSRQQFEKFKIFLPPKNKNNNREQQKIASCLSSLDELIVAQTEKIEQLKLHKKGLMQGLFPK